MPGSVITRYTCDTGLKLSRSVKIAHISDVHERNCDWLLPLLRSEKPDLILVTGDTFERYDNRPQYEFEHKPVKRVVINAIHFTNFIIVSLLPKRMRGDCENACRLLREAVKIAPVYMSLGNHEQKLLDEDYAFLNDIGVMLLDNADTEVDIKGFRFTLGGMSCWDWEDWLPGFLSKSGYKLLMCHKPDMYAEHLKDTDIDLTLSGHTHGGQFCIGKDGMGFFVPGQGLFGKYAHGRFFGGRLIVSAGCSNTVACPRVANPRELIIITMR